MKALSPILPPPVRPLRILCADDNTLLGDVMLSLFAREGYWVEHVEDGLQAWDRISQDLTNYDVVLTDHEMPKLKGTELVQLLREANYPGRIIVHSSSLSNAELEAYRAFGVTKFIMKSSRPDELLDAVSAGQ